MSKNSNSGAARNARQKQPVANYVSFERSQRLILSGPDSLTVLDLLDKPPKPNARLKRAARTARRLLPDG